MPTRLVQIGKVSMLVERKQGCSLPLVGAVALFFSILAANPEALNSIFEDSGTNSATTQSENKPDSSISRASLPSQGYELIVAQTGERVRVRAVVLITVQGTERVSYLEVITAAGTVTGYNINQFEGFTSYSTQPAVQ